VARFGARIAAGGIDGKHNRPCSDLRIPCGAVFGVRVLPSGSALLGTLRSGPTGDGRCAGATGDGGSLIVAPVSGQPSARLRV
jgi:hypothetical protein